MKRLLLLVALLPGTAFSQIAVNGVLLDTIPGLNVIQLVVGAREYRNQDIAVDYGQGGEIGSSSRITFGKDRQARQIRSTVEAINIFENNGWEYVEAIVYPARGSTSRQLVYLTFRRKKDNPSGR